MTGKFFGQMTLLLLGTTLALAAYPAGPHITRIQDVPDSADTPYENILVIALFSKFDWRRRLEKRVVEELAARGTLAIAATSMMDTRTPMTRQTYLEILEQHDSDAVLITHLLDIDSEAAMKDSASPEASYKVRPTYYFNVWDVRLTEYVEPQTLEIKTSLLLATQLYSVLSRDAVWAIESKSKVEQVGGPEANYLVYVDEAKAIVKHMARDGLIAR